LYWWQPASGRQRAERLATHTEPQDFHDEPQDFHYEPQDPPEQDHLQEGKSLIQCGMPFQNIDNHSPVRPFPINFPDAKYETQIKKNTKHKIQNTFCRIPTGGVFTGAKPRLKIFSIAPKAHHTHPCKEKAKRFGGMVY
jgi:hypothetical protein